MKRSLITLTGAVAVAVAAAFAAVALANSGAYVDKSGDVADHPSHPANYDLTRVTWGDTKKGKIVHTTKVKGTIGDPAHPFKPYTQFPQIFFDVPGKVGNSYCDYATRVDAGTPDHPTEAKAHVYKCGDNGPNPKPVGSMKLKRLDAHTLKWTFGPKVLGNPSKYGFWVATSEDSDMGFILADQAPNKGKLIHKL
jgi:hypothetical protein